MTKLNEFARCYVAKTIEEQLKGPGWHYLRLYGPSVDEIGHELEDGTYYEPTFQRNFQLVGMRSDGTHFCVNIMFEKDVELELLRKVGAAFVNGIMSLETFRACECLVGKRCEQHP